MCGRTGEEVKVPETRIGALTIAFEMLGEGRRHVVVTPGSRHGMRSGGVRARA